MAVTSIPPELRIIIAHLLDPRDRYHFALICRTNHETLKTLLTTHKAFHKRLAILNADNTGNLVWDVTDEIIQNPSRGRYIRNITIPTLRRQVWGSNRQFPYIEVPRNWSPTMPDDRVDGYVDAAKQIPILKDMVECDDYTLDPKFRYGPHWTWAQSASFGLDISMLTLLLPMAVDLETLSFTEWFHINDEFGEFIRHVSLAYQDPNHGLCLPFQHLTTVAVSCVPITHSGTPPEWAVYLLRIPTLGSLQLGVWVEPSVSMALHHGMMALSLRG